MGNRIEEQVALLNTELISMGALCEDAIAAAMKALSQESEEMVLKAAETERELDSKEREIESLCMKLLLRRQPVAGDLRLISAALRVISDMERIGDQACDIAEITRYIRGSEAKSRVHIYEMGKQTVSMVTESVDSFVRRDLALAREVVHQDDRVDKMFTTVRAELIALIENRAVSAELCLDLLMIAKYLERIGDHAVNIAEWVEYSITGIHKNGAIL